MRIVDWTVWKHNITIVALLLYFIMSRIHPAAVKCPVSASLVGRTSQVKLSVRSIARSIICCRNLKQRNQTLISGSLNVEIWAIKFFVNKIVKSVHYMYCLMWRPLLLSMLNVCLLSTFQKTLPLIWKSGIWTIHMFCSEASLSHYVS